MSASGWAHYDFQLHSSKAEPEKFGFCHCILCALGIVRCAWAQVPLDGVYHLSPWLEYVLCVTKITIVSKLWRHFVGLAASNRYYFLDSVSSVSLLHSISDEEVLSCEHTMDLGMTQRKSQQQKFGILLCSLCVLSFTFSGFLQFSIDQRISIN